MTRPRRRSRPLTVAWLALVAWLVADLVVEIVDGDVWRSIGFALALVCLIGIRRDLTTEPE